MVRPARILILHDYGGRRGGAEQLALDLRRVLCERGIEVRLLTSRADPWDEDDAPDVTCAGAHDRVRGLREAWNPDARRVLRREIAAFRPDIIHIFMFLTQLSPAILPALRSIPTVYSVNTYRPVCPSGLRWRSGHGLCTQTAGADCQSAGCFGAIGLRPRQLQLWLLDRGRAAIDRTVAPSARMAEILERHGWRCSDVVPHAVPAHHRLRPQSDRPVLAFAGRLTAEKGVDWLLRAVAAAGPALSGVPVHILGDGPERVSLERMASELNLGERVVFAGHRSREDTQSQLEEAWVQVVPSLWPEPFGLVAAEALTRGTAVIASDSGGPKEIVDHNQTGLVVPTGDVTALANALVTLTLDRVISQRMGEAGVAVARAKYGEHAWADAYLRIYSELLASGRKGATG